MSKLYKIRDEEIPDTYLIALSGHDDEREKENCLNIGFNGFLAKPIGLPDIIGILNDLKYLQNLYGD